MAIRDAERDPYIGEFMICSMTSTLLYEIIDARVPNCQFLSFLPFYIRVLSKNT